MPKASVPLAALGRSPARFLPESRRTKLLGLPLWRVDVRTGRVQSNIRWLAGRAIRALYSWMSHPLVRRIAQELRTWCLRICTRCGSQSSHRWVSFGEVGQLPFVHSPDAPLPVCMQDMRNTASLCRWATALEVQVWVQVWTMGARYGVDNGHSKSFRAHLERASKSSYGYSPLWQANKKRNVKWLQPDRCRAGEPVNWSG